MHSGLAEDEEATTARISNRAQGTLYELPCTRAGLDAFVADLLAVGPQETTEEGIACMLLPRRAPTGDAPCGWSSVDLDLLPPRKVEVQRLWECKLIVDWATGSAEDGSEELILFSGPHFSAAEAIVATAVTNRAAAYARHQAQLRRQVADVATGSAAGSAAAEPAEQPDSDEVYQQTWCTLRNQAMAELQAALGAMLRHAVRYRGPAAFQGAVPAPPAAAEADAQPAGGA